MCSEDNMICNENDRGFLVDALLTDATKRSKQSDADNGSPPDADPFAQGKYEPPRHRAEKEL